MKILGFKKYWKYKVMCKCGVVLEYEESDIREFCHTYNDGIGTRYDYIRCSECDDRINVNAREESI